jgi:hypothetical protein
MSKVNISDYDAESWFEEKGADEKLFFTII